jgi:hypothetical protein
MGEINLYGIYLPILLLQACLAYLLLRVCIYILQRIHAEQWILWPGLFYFFIYIALLWLIHTVWFL